MTKTLVVITGATASGKTALAIDVAGALGCDIISADSRQIYRDMPVGTAAPTAAELAAVRHHLVGVLPVEATYNAAQFEADALGILDGLWLKGDYVVMVGGSMMYIDAVTDGIDRLPSISDSTRERVKGLVYGQGMAEAMALLEILDPVHAARVDRANPRRVAHALEVCLESGRPYSELCTGGGGPRPFEVIKVAIDMPREELFDRINRRVDNMLEMGLEAEARRLYPYRSFNALNTVGYKEMFAWFDGEIDLDQARARIARNTRVYAKKQLTWLARPSVRPSVRVAAAGACEAVLRLVEERRR